MKNYKTNNTPATTTTTTNPATTVSATKVADVKAAFETIDAANSAADYLAALGMMADSGHLIDAALAEECLEVSKAFRGGYLCEVTPTTSSYQALKAWCEQVIDRWLKIIDNIVVYDESEEVEVEEVVASIEATYFDLERVLEECPDRVALLQALWDEGIDINFYPQQIMHVEEEGSRVRKWKASDEEILLAQKFLEECYVPSGKYIKYNPDEGWKVRFNLTSFKVIFERRVV